MISKFNINGIYRKGIFDNSFVYAKRHIELKGVTEILDEIVESSKKCKTDYHQLIDNNAENLDKKYSILQKNNRRKNISKYVFIITALLDIFIYSWVSFANIFVRFSYKIVLFAFWISMISWIIFKIKEYSLEKKYLTLTKQIESEASKLYQFYAAKNNIFYSEIDDIYLSSLDSAYRETVLMRRDQERQHREQLELQRTHQRILEEETRKTRIAQEELLKIEKAKEEARRRNSY